MQTLNQDDELGALFFAEFDREFVVQLSWASGKSIYLWSCRLGFDSESGQINDFKIGIHSFPA